jgi:hypothetical protein
LDAHEELQRIAGLNQIELRVVIIGFEFGQLQINPLEVGLADVAGVEACLT